MVQLDGVVHGSICGYCEHLEHRRSYVGNGHHLAQKLAVLAASELVLLGDKGLEILRTEIEAAKQNGGLTCPFCMQVTPTDQFKGHVAQCSLR